MRGSCRFLLVLPFAALAACSWGIDPAKEGRPAVTGLSRAAISVGESLYVAGTGFLAPDEGDERPIW